MARRKGLVINDRQLDRCDDLLQKLKEVSGSSFLALISTSGQPITTASDTYHPETLSLASLAASEASDSVSGWYVSEAVVIGWPDVLMRARKLEPETSFSF